MTAPMHGSAAVQLHGVVVLTHPLPRQIIRPIRKEDLPKYTVDDHPDDYWENGRRYHGFRKGLYMCPCDIVRAHSLYLRILVHD